MMAFARLCFGINVMSLPSGKVFIFITDVPLRAVTYSLQNAF